MTRSRILATALAATVLPAWIACGDDADPPTEPDPDPTPGHLSVSLTTPNDDDGAILLRVDGGPMTSPAAASSDHAFFFRETSATSVVVLLAGEIETGALLEFEVEDVDDAAAYSAEILEVADRENALRDDLADYALTVEAR
ncbi:MAG: hypothetical protein ACOC8B_05600 [Gemmatimonadota bacterium]